MTKLKKMDAKWYSELSGENYDIVYQLSDDDASYEGDYITVAHIGNSKSDEKSWCFMGCDRIWWFYTRESVVAFAKNHGFDVQEEKKATENMFRLSPYERIRSAVYATGNRWAIENFNATH